VVGNIGPERVVRDAEEAAHRAGDFSPQPRLGAPGSIGEGDDTNAVVGSHRQLGTEPGHQPVVLDDEMPSHLATEERQPDARQARIGLVVGGEHAGKRFGFEDRAVPVRATTQEGRDVAGHVCCGRGDRSGSDRHNSTVADRVGAIGTPGVPRRQARPDPLRSQQVGVGHAERLEEVLAEIAVQRLPADVLHDLAEGGEPVVAIGVPGAWLRHQMQTAPVELGERRQPPAEPHRLPQDRPERP
jgi:hypothetical protein